MKISARVYKIRVELLRGWTNYEDFELEIEEFNKNNKGIIKAEIIEIKTQGGSIIYKKEVK